MDRYRRRRSQRQLVSIDRRTIVRSPDRRVVEGTDARVEVGTDPRPLRLGRGGNASVRAVAALVDLRRGVLAGGLALEFSAAAALVGLRGVIDGRVVDQRA